MEENKKRKRKVIDTSVVLSFAVAIFAMVSLIACGFNQISYAAPVTGDNLTFNTWHGSDGRSWFVIGKDNSGVLENMFSVPLYFSDAGFTNPIFCVEHKADVNDKQSYVKGNAITDYGLLYLLNNSYVNDKTIIPSSNRYVEAWATQVAIWVYLYETAPSNPMNAITASEMSAIRGATKFELTAGADIGGNASIDFGYSIFDKHIRPLIDDAKKASALKQIAVTKADGDIVKTSDGKFYQTPVISVIGTPSGDLLSYDITLGGIDGAVVVGEDGNNLSTKNVKAGTKFYVRIPADKVTDKVQNLQIGVVGHFNTLSGHEYTSTSGNLQKVVSVTGTTTDVSGGLQIEVVGAPDTGMNTAQTIYFIGLIVLLCGVGIIYANAKPVESK